MNNSHTKESRPLSRAVGCYDCGLKYDSINWVDILIPDEYWLIISPTGHDGGLLCFKCMRKRLKNARLKNVPFRVYYSDPEDVMSSALYDSFDEDEKIARRWMKQSVKH